MHKENPDKEFVEDYLKLMELDIEDKKQMLENLKNFYSRVRQNVNLEKDYRILIKSKHKKRIDDKQQQAQVTSSEIAKLDKVNNLSSSDERKVYELFSLLKDRKMDKGEQSE